MSASLGLVEGGEYGGAVEEPEARSAWYWRRPGM